MNKKTSPKKALDQKNLVSSNYLVLTVSELDQLVFQHLVKIGAAKRQPKEKSGYLITDKQKAQSSHILPLVLNPLGKKGWNLTAVNKMECYIFHKNDRKIEYEYLVVTPPDLDKVGISLLQEEGHMKLSGFEGKVPKAEVTSPKDAKIQNLLPKILATYAKDNWQLCAVNGPQLYIFSRERV